MKYRPIRKEDIIVRAKTFIPRMPELVSINFATKSVTVLDLNDDPVVLPFDQVEICEIIDPKPEI